MLTTREQYRIMKLLTKHYKSSKITLKILLGRVTVGSSCLPQVILRSDFFYIKKALALSQC
ncbi:hypothetical protein D6118_12585 [Lactococcus lactis]|uniref:Uncharacterized protein n=1 Tax=Lactococcus lactis TaxID=1358 RepID=A0AAQ0R6P1_9LACT|nr:hypothetical protein B8W88_11930 [Lactococcus lactis]TLQ17337.1 hypothetical protein FEZ45_06390 [Lactococcus lactis subsp. lactis]PAL02330.1 hypothetical protein B8W91_12490 [Lactococcus lactis]RQE32381.1 hypothetical protein D6125_13325 [Lactococcus lactis]RQE33457.1 hypothetical protein D6120_04555 [Lactococcus lactis]